MSYQGSRTDESRFAIFIRGLRSDVNAEEVCDFFTREIGKCRVEFANLAHNRDFLLIAIRFDSHDAAQAAIDKFDGREIFRCKVNVAWYRNFRKPKALYTRRHRQMAGGSREQSLERERDADGYTPPYDQQPEHGGDDHEDARGLISAISSRRTGSTRRPLPSPGDHDSRRSRSPSNYSYNGPRGRSRSPSYPNGRYSPANSRDAHGPQSPVSRAPVRAFGRGRSRSRSRSRSTSPSRFAAEERSRNSQPLRKRPRNDDLRQSPPMRNGTPSRDDLRPARRDDVSRSSSNVPLRDRVPVRDRDRERDRGRVRERSNDRERRRSISRTRTLPQLEEAQHLAVRNGTATVSSVATTQRTKVSASPAAPQTPSENDMHSAAQSTVDGSGSIKLTEADLNTQMTFENVEKLNRKKAEVEARLRSDCETFATVVRMLINKDAHLSGLIEFALRECLRDLSARCVDELRNYAVELIASQNMLAPQVQIQPQAQRVSNIQGVSSTPPGSTKLASSVPYDRRHRLENAVDTQMQREEFAIPTATTHSNTLTDDNFSVYVSGAFDSRRVIRAATTGVGLVQPPIACEPQQQYAINRTIQNGRLGPTTARDSSLRVDAVGSYDLAVDEDMNI